LIAGLIGYKFPIGISAHQYLANLYGCDYETSKGLTFKYLYGGLDDFARRIPFFQKVDEYIENLYQRYVISGKLTTPLFKREIQHNRIESPNQQKIFNYLLQALETEINYMKMVEMLEFMNGMKSKIILYTYDAFLIDTHPSERERILEILPTIMEKGGFPDKVEEGKNYDNLLHLQ
jgi:DNA polymerase I-like protein with 3'-5' exonuclease and polymerase domains